MLTKTRFLYGGPLFHCYCGQKNTKISSLLRIKRDIVKNDENYTFIVFYIHYYII